MALGKSMRELAQSVSEAICEKVLSLNQSGKQSSPESYLPLAATLVKEAVKLGRDAKLAESESVLAESSV